MAKYNGYKNWNAWNVSLWINNEYNLYCLAKDCVRYSKNRNQAAIGFVEIMAAGGVTETPDGAKYNKTNVKTAMIGM